jgi:hypothetical protein
MRPPPEGVSAHVNYSEVWKNGVHMSIPSMRFPPRTMTRTQKRELEEQEPDEVAVAEIDGGRADLLGEVCEVDGAVRRVLSEDTRKRGNELLEEVGALHNPDRMVQKQRVKLHLGRKRR